VNKAFLTLIFGLAASLSFSQEKLTVYGLAGPSGVGMIHVFEQPPRVPGFEIKAEALAQADLMAAKFISGEAKIGVLPPNVAAKLAASGVQVQAAAVLGTGMLSLLSTDQKIRSIADLKGKAVDIAGQGATPDYVFRRILGAYGLDAGRDLQLRYSLSPPEIAQALIAGRITTALLPEPFATMARNGRRGLQDVADIQREWSRLVWGAGNYPMTVLVVEAAFAREHPGLIRVILGAVEDSVSWVKANPDAAGALVEKHRLGLTKAVATAAIPRSNYVFIPATEARPALEALYQAFLEYSPQAIGGIMPFSSFYYK
jgi:NitT/TauT family transport system substrate-binding protein